MEGASDRADRKNWIETKKKKKTIRFFSMVLTVSQYDY